MHGAPCLHHDLFTNDILYLDMAFDLHGLPEDLLPYMSLFAEALTEMGTAKEDFVALTQRINRKVGGVHQFVLVSPASAGREAMHLMIRAKGTSGQLPDLLAILTDILLEPNLSNRQKFKQLVLEEKVCREGSALGLFFGWFVVVDGERERERERERDRERERERERERGREGERERERVSDCEREGE